MIETEFTKIIQKIITANGKNIFLEPKKFKALLLDYTKNNFKKESSLLLTIIDADCVKYINNTENIAECKKFLVKRLEDDYSLSLSKSAEMLDMLFLVLRNNNTLLQSYEKKSKHKINNEARIIFERYLKNHDSNEGIKDFTEAIKINPNNAEYYHLRGFIYSMEHQQDKSIEDFTEAIKLNPDNAVYYHLRGSDYVDKGQCNAAIKDFTEVIRLNHYYKAEAYRDRGEAYYVLGNYSEAIKDLTEAIRLNCDDKDDAYTSRGLVYIELGQKKQAEKDLKKALSINAGNELAKNKLKGLQ